MHDTTDSGDAAFLVLSHPGHELRLLRWIETHRPLVFIMSDGSGGAATSRIEYSRTVLATAGARAGEIFGQTSDRVWYAALLANSLAPFQDVVTAVVRAARRDRPNLIVSDAVDGHNPLHDICEAIGGAVVARLASESIVTRHLVAPATVNAIGVPEETWTLDHGEVTRKRAAISGYTPLAEEARRILEEEPAAVQVEQLLHPTFTWPRHWSPAWEEFGRQRIAAGRFAQPITYAEHVRPVVKALLADLQ
jgi:hypothetical protein